MPPEVLIAPWVSQIASEGVRCSEPLRFNPSRGPCSRLHTRHACSSQESLPAASIRMGFSVGLNKEPGMTPSMLTAARKRGSSSTPRSAVIPPSECPASATRDISSAPANGLAALAFRRTNSSMTNFKSLKRTATASEVDCLSICILFSKWLPKTDLASRPSGNWTAVASNV